MKRLISDEQWQRIFDFLHNEGFNEGELMDIVMPYIEGVYQGEDE